MLLIDWHPECSALLMHITPVLNLENQLAVLSHAYCFHSESNLSDILYVSVAVLHSLKQKVMFFENCHFYRKIVESTTHNFISQGDISV
jgi:hypothetical protein